LVGEVLKNRKLVTLFEVKTYKLCASGLWQ